VVFHLMRSWWEMRRERVAGLGLGLRPLLGREPPWDLGAVIWARFLRV